MRYTYGWLNKLESIYRDIVFRIFGHGDKINYDAIDFFTEVVGPFAVISAVALLFCIIFTLLYKKLRHAISFVLSVLFGVTSILAALFWRLDWVTGFVYSDYALIICWMPVIFVALISLWMLIICIRAKHKKSKQAKAALDAQHNKTNTPQAADTNTALLTKRQDDSLADKSVDEARVEEYSANVPPKANDTDEIIEKAKAAYAAKKLADQEQTAVKEKPRKSPLKNEAKKVKAHAKKLPAMVLIAIILFALSLVSMLISLILTELHISSGFVNYTFQRAAVITLLWTPLFVLTVIFTLKQDRKTLPCALSIALMLVILITWIAWIAWLPMSWRSLTMHFALAADILLIVFLRSFSRLIKALSEWLKTIDPVKTEPAPAPHLSKVTAVLLAIFLGSTGAHRYYLGYKKKGIMQSCGFALVIIGFGLYEGAIASQMTYRYHEPNVGLLIAALVMLLPGLACSIWAFVDFIRILTGGLKPADGSQFADKTAPAQTQTYTPQAPTTPADENFAALEKLASLYEQGILTEEEYNAKKAEVLKRI